MNQITWHLYNHICSSLASVLHDLQEDSASRPTRSESGESRRVAFQEELVDFSSKPRAKEPVALTIASVDLFIFAINMPKTLKKDELRLCNFKILWD